MPVSLSELADNMSGIFNTMESKSCIEKNKINSELKNKCKKCKKELIEKFSGIYQLCNDDLNKFVLLLRKGVYPYEYMDSWEKFNETALPPKKDFYSNLNLENISDEDYTHAQKICDVFEIKISVNITIYMFKVIHYYLQIYLKILEICVLIYMNLILYILHLHLD